MSRPAPTILTQQRIGKTDWEIRIQAGEGHWVVVYQDQPINIVKDYYYADRKKYMRNGFAHAGHAANLARKLNAQFGTQDFPVRKIL
jgi:hypothetical protein